MNLQRPLIDDWCYLARNCRADERVEFAAMTGQAYDPELAARAWITTPGPQFVLLGPDGLPLAAAGFEPLRPGVYAAWMVATPQAWETHWRSITKACVRGIRGMFSNAGAHRVQITTLASREAALIWYVNALGLSFEGRLPGGAADGSDTVIYGRAA